MTLADPLALLAQGWGLDDSHRVADAATSRISAVRWRHSLPELAAAEIPVNTLAYAYRFGRSYRHMGGKVERGACDAGHFAMVAKGTDGSWSFDDPIDVIHLYLPDQLLIDAAEPSQAGLPDIRENLCSADPAILALMREASWAMAADERSAMYIDTLGAALASVIAKRFMVGTPVRHDPVRGGLASWAERRCRDYLQARLAENVSLHELAAVANLSPFHFARMFKQSTGLPPHAYLRRLRAERACALLRDTQLSVAEVANAVGYETPQAFARMFRGEIGTTPSVWRAGAWY